MISNSKMMFIDLPIDACRYVLQFVELTDIVRFKMAFGKALECHIQEIIKGMVLIPMISVRTTYLGRTWYVNHLHWAMSNNIHFQDLSVSLQNESPLYREFLRNFISHTGEYVQRLELRVVEPRSIDFLRELLRCMPNITCLNVGSIRNLPDLDIIELFGHLSLTSLVTDSSSKTYIASQVFSTWSSLNIISLPMVFDPEMTPGLGQSLKALTVDTIDIDNSNWDLLKYFPNLERVVEDVENAVCDNHIMSIAKYCPQIQTLKTILRSNQIHYLSHLENCQQLTTLCIDYSYHDSQHGAVLKKNLQSLPRLKKLRCIYNEELLKGCPNITQLGVKIKRSECILEGLIHLVHLTYLEMNIPTYYYGSAWSVFMLVLLTKCPMLQTLICEVGGTVALDRDMVCDIIGFGHKQLREVYIRGEGEKNESNFDWTTSDILKAAYSKRGIFDRVAADEIEEQDYSESESDLENDIDSTMDIEIDCDSLMDTYHDSLFNLEKLRDERNTNVAPKDRYKCPKLTHMVIVVPLRDTSYDQLARCPNLKKLRIYDDNIDFRRLVKSCSQLERLHISSSFVCHIFHHSHKHLKRLEICKTMPDKMYPPPKPPVYRRVGKYPALKDLSLSGEISSDEWQLIVASCKHSRIQRLEFTGLNFMSLFTDSFIETIIQDDAFSELQYFVWSGIHSECNAAQSAFIDALSSAGKGRFSVVLPLHVRKLDVVRRIDFE